MKNATRTAITNTIIGTMLICPYLLGVAQMKTETGTQATTMITIADDRHITIDAAVFQDGYGHYVDMQQVTGFEVSADGLQLYFTDGAGYYWER